MLAPRYQRVSDRLEALAAEARVLIDRAERAINKYIEDTDALSSVIVRSRNIVEVAFGAESPHARHLIKLIERGVYQSFELRPVVGVLDGARDDLEHGFLQKQELLIAGEVFDSVLQEAKHLDRAGHVDAAAVLGRVVLEDSLRRLADANGISPAGKAASLNDELKRTGAYGQPMWRQVQAWLDVGNAAAHGQVSDYTPDQVASMLTGIEQFIATTLTT